ncbi:nitroreductase/quinone reductase family protein [Actinomadura viridis]|uniref:Deazaflavin-dependent oxidoreductase (Nitroreductase family) n=1 Tax=Actinomadura viridis TaxID=58110 RepID=A0A931DFM9_9ACTN|nr:nitroreductase/quinone reductase family protein [Actinomadura viridis]MBG6088357.1 deazaflavin-dependent oxidoreductase (nitroreductase family) [Actinomadura viridis]
MTEEFSAADLNRAVIEEFRANAGRVGGMFEGAALLLLTTTGARTGRRRTTPLAYLDDGDRVLVFGSNAGAPTDPAWLSNVLADSRVTVEIGAGDGVETYEATAMRLHGPERDRLYALQSDLVPAYAEYQRMTSRTIPVVALHRADSDRSLAMGDQLLRIHAGLRHDLEALRAEVETYLGGENAGGDGDAGDAGRGGAGAARPAPDLAVRLRTHCLAFCDALGAHHDGEETRGFPPLERRYPDLAPVLDRLRREHVAVTRLRDELRALIDDLESADPARVRAELDRVTAGLEAHYAYEEEQLTAALNAMSAADWAGPAART